MTQNSNKRRRLDECLSGANSEDEQVILVMGACCMDRILRVCNYPTADSKVKSTSYHATGGGNAANTATAMALLNSASFLRIPNLKIKLLSKVGDDGIAIQLMEELKKSGVDLSSPLFRKGPEGSTTGFTTVLVSEQEHTRTCIHTHGTCGVLTGDDVAAVDMDEIFRGVLHFHSDSRHTEAAAILAQEARKRNIPVSVDAEKDRQTPHLDPLLELATIVLTNDARLTDYRKRKTKEWEKANGRPPLQPPVFSTSGGNVQYSNVSTYSQSIKPSHFFLRRYGASQIDKEIVITKGSMGSVRVQCTNSETEKIPVGNQEKAGTHKRVVSFDEQTNQVVVRQTLIEVAGLLTETEYRLNLGGVLRDMKIVDTTGAGDAFAAGFILAQLVQRSSECWDMAELGLDFGAWVAGKKICGPGARSSLPTASDVDEQLGKEPKDVKEKLRSLLLPFGGA